MPCDQITAATVLTLVTRFAAAPHVGVAALKPAAVDDAHTRRSVGVVVMPFCFRFAATVKWFAAAPDVFTETA